MNLGVELSAFEEKFHEKLGVQYNISVGLNAYFDTPFGAKLSGVTVE